MWIFKSDPEEWFSNTTKKCLQSRFSISLPTSRITPTEIKRGIRKHACQLGPTLPTLTMGFSFPRSGELGPQTLFSHSPARGNERTALANRPALASCFTRHQLLCHGCNDVGNMALLTRQCLELSAMLQGMKCFLIATNCYRCPSPTHSRWLAGNPAQ